MSDRAMNDAAKLQPPFAEFLGIKITHVSPERVTAELPMRQELNNRFDIMHGGAIMALADNLGGTASNRQSQGRPVHDDDREQDQFLRRDPDRRCRQGGMHATPSRPHHHGLADPRQPW